MNAANVTDATTLDKATGKFTFYLPSKTREEIGTHRVVVWVSRSDYTTADWSSYLHSWLIDIADPCSTDLLDSTYAARVDCLLAAPANCE